VQYVPFFLSEYPHLYVFLFAFPDQRHLNSHYCLCKSFANLEERHCHPFDPEGEIELSMESLWVGKDKL
jgi:hypothetical protein